MDPLQTTVRSMGGVIIDLYGSFFIQLAIVLLVMAVLKQLIFEPYLATLEAREKKTDRTREDAEAIKARAEALAEQYATDLATARSRATEARQVLRTDGAARREQVIGEARRVATAKMSAAHAAIDAQYEGARGDLKTQVSEIAGLVVDKVIGDHGRGGAA